MKTLFGCALSAVLLAALGYSFHHLVLRPAAVAAAARSAANDRLPTIPATTTAEPAVAAAKSAAPAGSDRLVLPAVPARPTPADLIAVLEHGTDEQAAAAGRELVATGDPALP